MEQQTALRMALGPGFAFGGPSEFLLRTVSCTASPADATTTRYCPQSAPVRAPCGSEGSGAPDVSRTDR